MKKILFICPISGNGGIQSWTRKMLATFPDDEFDLYHLNVSHRRSVNKSKNRIKRELDGVLDMVSICLRTFNAVRKQKFELMHTTTSGNIGTLRDYFLVRICHMYHLKCIMHCRYGCIEEDFNSKGFWGRLLRKTMHLYDNIWVLDNRSRNALTKDPLLEKKVYLTPNSIDVPETCDLGPKEYREIAFVGNLLPNKGLYELVHAVADYNLNVRLTIAGPERPAVLSEIKRIADEKWNKSIRYIGKLSNPEAVQLINSIDILVLASYFPSEAFPISILEAMSHGKMVIATPRAAISDMLTDLDGEYCGCIVEERSIEDIYKAIVWCQEHKKTADEMCAKAFKKAKNNYSTHVIYNLYRTLYNKLINS